MVSSWGSPKGSSRTGAAATGATLVTGVTMVGRSDTGAHTAKSVPASARWCRALAARGYCRQALDCGTSATVGCCIAAMCHAVTPHALAAGHKLLSCHEIVTRFCAGALGPIRAIKPSDGTDQLNV